LLHRHAGGANRRRNPQKYCPRDVTDRPAADLFPSDNEQAEKQFRAGFENYETFCEIVKETGHGWIPAATGKPSLAIAGPGPFWVIDRHL
jgi:hypothetical protein